MQAITDKMLKNYHISKNRDEIRIEYGNSIKDWEIHNLDKILQKFGHYTFYHMWKNSTSKELSKRCSRIIAKKQMAQARKNGSHNKNHTLRDYIDIFSYGEIQYHEEDHVWQGRVSDLI